MTAIDPEQQDIFKEGMILLILIIITYNYNYINYFSY